MFFIHMLRWIFFYYQTNYVIFKYVILFFKKIEFETY